MILPYVLIMFSIKMSYYFDTEKSLNFAINPMFEEIRNTI